MALSAGVARVNVTPPIGIALVGFAGRGPAEEIEDDLFVTALALEDSGVRALLLTADLIGFGERFVAEVRAEITRRVEIPPENILLCASHTHYGPVTGAYETELPEDVAAYLANLKYLMAGAAQVAMARLQPVRLGFGEGESFIGVNRRERRPDGQIILGQNPDGPCDRSVRVMRLDTADGKPLAALVNFACHPVSATHAFRSVSADYIASMRKLVETATGATCLFLQGASGNINPIEMRHSAEPARRLGLMLGGEVIAVFEATRTILQDGLSSATTRAELPAMTFASLDEGLRSVEELQATLTRLEAENAPEGSRYWAESRLRRAEDRLESLRTGVPLPTLSAELNALRFGDVALVTAPGEIFTETGLEVKRRSPLPHTCFVAYTNGAIGYVPVPSAYPEGGYEVTHACQVGPDAAGIIAEQSLALLDAVRNGDSKASTVPTS